LPLLPQGFLQSPVPACWLREERDGIHTGYVSELTAFGQQVRSKRELKEEEL